MKKTLLSLFATTLLCACNTQSLIDSHGNIVIDAAHAIAENTLDLSSFTESSKLVVLKTPENAMQAMITKAQLYDGKIFTFDELQTKKVNAYTIDGEYLFSVGRIGRGPGEMTGIANFSIHEDQIYLTSVMDKKTLVFSTDNGELISTMNYPFMASGVNILSDNRFMFSLTDYNTPMGGEYLVNSIVVTDSLFNPIVFGGQHPVADRVEFLTRSHWNTAFRSKFYSMHSENIYQYDPVNDSISRLYTFDFGSDNMPAEARKNIDAYHRYYGKEDVARLAANSPVIIGNYVFGQIKKGNAFYFLVHKDNETHAIEVNEKTYVPTNPIFVLGGGADKDSKNVLISNVMIGENTDELKEYGIDYNDDVMAVLLITKLK